VAKIKLRFARELEQHQRHQPPCDHRQACEEERDRACRGCRIGCIEADRIKQCVTDGNRGGGADLLDEVDDGIQESGAFATAAPGICGKRTAAKRL
jgi:hypothetical protein